MRHPIALVALLFMAGCSDPNPWLEQHPQYIGEWKSEDTTLVIKKNGYVKFLQHRIDEAKTNHDVATKATSITDIKAPLIAIKHNSIQIGEGNLKKELSIQKPPYQFKNQWQMVLDDQTFVRQ